MSKCSSFGGAIGSVTPSTDITGSLSTSADLTTVPVTLTNHTVPGATWPSVISYWSPITATNPASGNTYLIHDDSSLAFYDSFDNVDVANYVAGAVSDNTFQSYGTVGVGDGRGDGILSGISLPTPGKMVVPWVGGTPWGILATVPSDAVSFRGTLTWTGNGIFDLENRVNEWPFTPASYYDEERAGTSLWFHFYSGGISRYTDQFTITGTYDIPGVSIPLSLTPTQSATRSLNFYVTAGSDLRIIGRLHGQNALGYQVTGHVECTVNWTISSPVWVRADGSTYPVLSPTAFTPSSPSSGQVSCNTLKAPST